MKQRLFSGVWPALLLLGHGALAQTGSADSSLVVAAASGLRQYYTAIRGAEARLHNGPEYVNHVKDYITGHPFFESADAQDATIEYDGATYTDVPLSYDLMLGQLVIKAPLGALDMRLINEKVTRFTVDGHAFVRLVTDSLSDSSVRTGFYEVLADGPVRVLAARKKGLQERSTSTGMEGEITQKNELFIEKDHRYYKADKASAVLALFPVHKAALRQYIRAQNLTFRAASRENDLAALVRYQATLPSAAAQAN